MEDILNTRRFVKIMAGPSQGSKKTVYYRKDLPYEVAIKWHWYFKYRAALIQVNNPRWYVELTSGSHEFVMPIEEKRRLLKDKITAKKAKITKVINEFERVKREWVSIFPIEQDHRYEPTVLKIEELKNELKSLEFEYKQFESCHLQNQ